MTPQEIKRLQQFLCDNGFTTDVDGKYGNDTKTKLTAYVTAKLSRLNYTLPKRKQIVYIRTERIATYLTPLQIGKPYGFLCRFSDRLSL